MARLVRPKGPIQENPVEESAPSGRLAGKGGIEKNFDEPDSFEELGEEEWEDGESGEECEARAGAKGLSGDEERLRKAEALMGHLNKALRKAPLPPAHGARRKRM